MNGDSFFDLMHINEIANSDRAIIIGAAGLTRYDMEMTLTEAIFFIVLSFVW
jgi:hypothetical protein